MNSPRSGARPVRTTTDPRHVPRKRFSQHFLTDAWARRVVTAINPQPGDVFLEIGPGEGALTMPLAATGAPILAVEIDRDLASALASQVPRNVSIITGDFLKTDVIPFLTGLEPQRPPQSTAELPARRLRVVGNLPYHLSSPILFRLIELHLSDALFADATVMLQKEVAERIAAKPSTKAYGVLSIHAQIHADISLLLRLPPAAFRPAPKVHSAIVGLTFRPPQTRIVDFDIFERLVRMMFSQRRKTLANAIKPFDASSGIVLALSGIDGRRRPETLTLAEIGRLVELFATAKRPAVL